MEYLYVLGLIFLVIGIFLIVISLISNSGVKVKFGFGGFIGPIPFGFANSPGFLKVIIIISIIFLIAFVLLNL